MNPLEAISKIRQAGGTVIVESGDLQISCPPGVITKEAAACLRENKPDLVRILTPPDEERSALQWLEGLPPAKADVVLSKAIREWDELVGLLNTSPDPDGDPWPADGGSEPSPCPQCDSLTAWQDMRGDAWHCATCDPPTKALRLLRRTQRIRRRYNPV